MSAPFGLPLFSSLGGIFTVAKSPKNFNNLRCHCFKHIHVDAFATLVLCLSCVPPNYIQINNLMYDPYCLLYSPWLFAFSILSCILSRKTIWLVTQVCNESGNVSLPGNSTQSFLQSTQLSLSSLYWAKSYMSWAKSTWEITIPMIIRNDISFFSLRIYVFIMYS